MDHQKTLGINSLYYGYFSTTWLTFHHRYLKFRKLLTKYDQAAIGIKMIMTTIHKYVYNLWLMQNKHCCEGLGTGFISFIRSSLILELQSLYASHQEIFATDRDLFDIPIAQQTRKIKTNQLKLLVKDTKMILKKSHNDAIDLMKDSPNLLTYFGIQYVQLPPEIYPPALPPPEPDP